MQRTLADEAIMSANVYHSSADVGVERVSGDMKICNRVGCHLLVELCDFQLRNSCLEFRTSNVGGGKRFTEANWSSAVLIQAQRSSPEDADVQTAALQRGLINRG
jgi:hypothetical protein